MSIGKICTMFCLLLALILSGCAKAAPPPEPVTISFAHLDFPGLTDYYQQLIEQFNESHPHVTIELKPAPFNFAAPFDPGDADTFTTLSFDLLRLREQGNILSLAPFIDQDESFDLSDFHPGAVDIFTSEGETWAIPAGLYMYVVYYNQDLFDARDVPYPEIGWTQDDFLSTALAINDPQAYIFGYVPIDGLVDPMVFIYQRGGRLFDDLQNPTRTTFDDPLTIKALEWYADLIHEHNVIPTHQQMLDKVFGGTERSGVYLGKVGTWIGLLTEQGGRGGGGWPAEWDFRWGMVPLPRGAQAVTPAFVDGYAISSQAQHLDACWQWITFLSEQMTQYGGTPARKSLVGSDEYEQLVGSGTAAVVRASLEDAVLIAFTRENFGDVGIFVGAMEAIISGRSTPEEAMIGAQRQAEE